MAYDGLFFRSLVSELSQLLTGGKIDKIHQPEKDELTIGIRSGAQNFRLKLSADASLPHLSLSEEKKENPLQAPMFCMLLRKHLAGGKILSITQSGLERIVEIAVESRDELGDVSTKILVIEVMGKHSNIILYQASDFKILESIKRISALVSRSRQVYPGIPYTPPPFSKRNLLTDEPCLIDLKDSEDSLTKYLVKEWQGFSPATANQLFYGQMLPLDLPLCTWQMKDLEKALELILKLKAKLLKHEYNFGLLFADEAKTTVKEVLSLSTPALEAHFPIKGYDSAISVTTAFFGNKDKSNRLDQKGAHMRKAVVARLEKAEGKHAKLTMDYHNAESAELYKISGELLLANIYQLDKGMSFVELDNYYEDPVTPLKIDLDLRLTPAENAQRYFKRYNKAKIGQIEILKQLEETEAEMRYLEAVLTAIDNSGDAENLEDIRDELADQGYVKRKMIAGKSKKKKMSYMSFTSSEGFEILVGKNNVQNDYITLRLASNKDLWLHTKIIPGSHVIVRTEGADCPEQTLYEAAVLAAYHSKARQSGQVPVDYTLVKNIIKPNGAKPGMVVYNTNKTIYVTPDEALVAKLKTNLL